jgi:hypothetical protein
LTTEIVTLAPAGRKQLKFKELRRSCDAVGLWGSKPGDRGRRQP